MMKALTVYQPWASLLACGAKQYETRSWATKYRGPIVIHAATKKPPKQVELPWEVFNAITTALTKHYGGWRFDWHLGGVKINHDGTDNGFDIPRGCVIAVANLVNCWHIVYHPGTNVDIAKHIPIGAESLTTDKHAPDFADYFVPTETEMLFGDWTPGRYAWQLEDVHQLKEPIPARGMQRIWNWDETEHLVAIDPYAIGSTKIWTPKGIMTGKKVDPNSEDAVRGLEVA